MSEIEINTQCQRRKISKLANASLICMIAEYGLLTLPFLFLDTLTDNEYICEPFIILIATLLLTLFIATPVLGILSLIQIRKSKGLLYGKLRAAIAIIMSILLTYYILSHLTAVKEAGAL